MFYGPSASSFNRHHQEEMAMVFSGIDCLLNGERAVYVSTELTSGKRLYDAFLKHGAKSRPELREIIGAEAFQETIWNLNVAAGAEFARRVRTMLGGGHMVITPGPFDAPGWSQPEYLEFWERLIRERISAAWFNDNWEFSNGCAFEFAVAQDAGLPTFDATGQVLPRTVGLRKISDAVVFLDRHGFDASKLRESRERLEQVVARV